MLKVNNLKISVEGKAILNGVSLVVKPGEVVALMGPNGCGKSSLAYTLAGSPSYIIDSQESQIFLDEENLLEMTPDKRAQTGLFLAFQYPMEIEGISVREFLLSVLRKKGKEISALDLKQEIQKEAKEMKINLDLLKRGLNEDFSGGEKKKMEILQMKILKPKYVILDEIDSGLDIDALKIVAKGVRELVQKNKTGVLVITHYQRILKHLEPDRVLVMKEGKIVKEGKSDLVSSLEKDGYEKI